MPTLRLAAGRQEGAGRPAFRRTALTLAALLTLVASLPFCASAASDNLLTATVLRVSDGDTLTAETDNGTKLRIRLLGIDAPEISHNGKPGQPYGTAATEYLLHLVGGKSVETEVHGHDRHNRVLAVLWVNGHNVNLEMVRAGYAEVYRGAPCQVYCGELQQAEWEAQRERLGIWADRSTYESPRAFRARHRVAGE
jgi:endonuclease YncB( thermonuclease family)